MSTEPSQYRPGDAVTLRPRKGCEVATYARVTGLPTSSTVRVIVTVDSGGRRRGATYTVPLGLLSPRHRGQHRKSTPRRPRAQRWWGR